MFVTRVCRNKPPFLLKDQPKSTAKGQQSITANPEIDDNVDDKTDYQELTKVTSTDNYTYDTLK